MNVRWAIWTIGIAALALVALFPLRLALAWSDFERIGFAARQVAGTIWYGRIGDLQLRSQPVGTLEVTLDPVALLVGSISMKFSRLDSPEGPLTGQLVVGRKRGIRSTSGRIPVGEIFTPIPVGAVELTDVTVLFRNGQCAEAGGRIAPILAAPIPGLQINPGLSGAVECEGERARVRMESASGAERIEFYVRDSGDYRAWMTIRSSDPVMNSGLALFGFRPSADGLRLSVDGRL
ncbi:MAG: type II secretion system protein N [Alphaproteobacteria bacterium]